MSLALVLTILFRIPCLLLKSLVWERFALRRGENYVKKQILAFFLLHMKLVASIAIRKRFYFLARSISAFITFWHLFSLFVISMLSISCGASPHFLLCCFWASELRQQFNCCSRACFNLSLLSELKTNSKSLQLIIRIKVDYDNKQLLNQLKSALMLYIIVP